MNHLFDEVVMTAPLGWLKRNKDVFIPALPPRLSQAIDSISYGDLEKVHINFPAAFWNVSHSQSEGKTIFPAETLFLAPEYARTTNPQGWNQEIFSFAALPPPDAHPTLMFYIYGACATHITNLISSLPQDSKKYYEVLEVFFKPYYSRLPGYSSLSSDCKPTGFIATNWQNDKFAGYGSYSNYQVGLQEGDHDIEVMRRGVGVDRGIWLAGEHTAPFAALGTVTGAYWSGEVVAKTIIGLYDPGKSQVDDARLNVEV
jgi:Flavin containing amine oxidoreductase